MAKDRKADRHVKENWHHVSGRLGDDDFEALETARKERGLNRRQALIAAIRQWVATDHHDPVCDTTGTAKERDQ